MSSKLKELRSPGVKFHHLSCRRRGARSHVHRLAQRSEGHNKSVGVCEKNAENGEVSMKKKREAVVDTPPPSSLDTPTSSSQDAPPPRIVKTQIHLRQFCLNQIHCT
ncbi:hypothetical protein L195_g009929 [Trifolium pratense]|uniref:Uncharacterized protein n=1 Tax=Trifolium pratense TaxID=57577 RepID=A0A2K3PDB1_TRIPR|nr:hypothetical protein L195_g009929 [Trifolium pratense]